MSDPIFNGGPANPIGSEPGISIRDYFAAATLTGIHASGSQTDLAAAIILAYQQADEALRVRELSPLVPPPEPEPEPIIPPGIVPPSPTN